MARNLMRDSKLYVSTQKDTGFSDSNTFRINILDGFSFSQDTSTQEITLSEAGDKPIRGQKVFNTALNPVEFSFSSYIRPFMDGSNHSAVEQILWEALVGADTLGTNAVPGTESLTVDFEKSDVHELLKLYLFFEFENVTYRINEAQVNQAEVDFSIDGIAMITWSGQGNSYEEIPFDLAEDYNPKNPSSPWVAGTTFTAVASNAAYLKNRLSSVELYNEESTTGGYQEVSFASVIYPSEIVDTTGTLSFNVTVDGEASPQAISVAVLSTDTKQDLLDAVNYQLDGANVEITSSGNLRITSVTEGTNSSISIASGSPDLLAAFGGSPSIGSAVDGTGTRTSYSIPITGGSLTINNNITFLTPEDMGTLNQPIGSFTGSRQIGGELTAYLNTGAGNTGGLIDDLISSVGADTTDFNLVLRMGATSATGPRVEFEMNHAHITIPTINVEDVVSTTVSFTGLGQALEIADELLVRYYAQ